MESVSPVVTSTRESTNYARLCRLLVDVGCSVLQDIFDRIHPPANLHLVLLSPTVLPTLQSLRKKRVLNSFQWGKLFPFVGSTVSSANFDITLLMVLLSNVCGLNPPVSTHNWYELPSDSDNSIEANVVRIKWYRNNIYGHAHKASVDDATFKALWQKITSAVLALGSETSSSAMYETVISRLTAAESMDPAAEVLYVKSLSDWQKDEDSSKEVLEGLEEMNESCQGIKEKVAKIEENLKMQEDSTDAELEMVEEMNESCQGIKEKVAKIEENLKMQEDSTDAELEMVEEMPKSSQGKSTDTLHKILEMLEKLHSLEGYASVSQKDEKDPSGLIKHISVIRQLYEDREAWLAPFPWCEEFTFHLDDIFTRLRFVSRSRKLGRKTDDIVDMFQIFQSHEECSQPRRVLIEGQPGMGKTTYCDKIAYDWAKKRKSGESFPDFVLVLLLKCRNINCGLWEAIDDQLLPREVDEEEKERFFTFMRDHQSKVLLVLDGLDELPSRQLSIYQDIIQGRVLPESYIVVTARQEVGAKVRDCCHTLLEVEGFTMRDAEQFILRYFRAEKDLAEKLLERLNSDLDLQHLTANPLNTALLCLLCEDSGGHLPESRTQLYLEIVECVLRRYRLKMKLPATREDLVVLYKDELKQLGRIAMEGLHKDSIYFDESAFQGFSSDLKSGFGFLSVEAGRSKRRPGRSYRFLQESFQKLFAAFFLCCQLLDEEISQDSLVADHRYFIEFKEVLRFICGMLAQRNKEKAKALIASMASQVNLKQSSDYLHVTLNCISECGEKQSMFDKKLARDLGSLLELKKVFIKCLGKRALDALVEVMETNSTVTYLCLDGSEIGDVGATALAKCLEENSTLSELSLISSEIGDDGFVKLAQALKVNSTLTLLDLTGNRVGDKGTSALQEALKERQLKFQASKLELILKPGN